MAVRPGAKTAFRFAFDGGEDHVSSIHTRAPGSLVFSQNIQPSLYGGYEKILGYERVDGRLAPSEAIYYTLRVASTSFLLVGDTVQGGTSGATAKVVGVFPSFLALTAGGFVAGENLLKGATVVTQTTAPSVAMGEGVTPAKHAELLHAVATERRNAIQPVPGTGPVRGVWEYKGTVYAIRDLSAEEAAALYRATSSGWVIVYAQLPKGGTYRFANADFGQGEWMFMVNGVGPPLAFDGYRVVELQTNMPLDKNTPFDLVVHRHQLWLAFSGGNVMYSPPGNPFISWTALNGAGEINLEGEIAGMIGEYFDTLIIWTTSAIIAVFGTPGASDFALRRVAGGTGARRWTPVRYQDPVFMADQGITTLKTSQAFGDFAFAQIDHKVRPIVQALAQYADLMGVAIPAKNQLRFISPSSGQFLSVFLSGRDVVFTRGQYYHPMYSVWVTPSKRIFAGALSSGYAYELEKGWMFDDQPIKAVLVTAPNALGVPLNWKRVHRVDIEATATASGVPILNIALNYDIKELPETFNLDEFISTGLWDISKWGEAVWDSGGQHFLPVYVDGVGVLVSLVVRDVQPLPSYWSVRSALYEYTVLGVRK